MPSEKPKRTNKKNALHKIDLDILQLSLEVPSERTEHSLLVHADSFTWVPPNSIDLVLTDPPFNIARDTNFHTYENNTINSYRFDADKGWDTYSQQDFITLLNSWTKEFARVLRPGGSFAIFCADAYLSHLIDALKASELSPRRTLTWRKPNAVPVNRKSMMMSACEYVVVGVKGNLATFNSDIDLNNLEGLRDIEMVLASDKVSSVIEKAVRDAILEVDTLGADRASEVEAAVKKAILSASDKAAKKVHEMYLPESNNFQGCVPNYVSFNSKAGGRLHPTEKPVNLLRYLMALMSNPGDLVLDPFGGSGSTGEAALGLKRRVILVEKDEEYFPKLKERITTIASLYVDYETPDAPLAGLNALKSLEALQSLGAIEALDALGHKVKNEMKDLGISHTLEEDLYASRREDRSLEE